MKTKKLATLRTEAEITANWKGNIDKPVVSICCIAYNHEPYIEDALEGFLMQETNFPFEILIHDDASTDKTADIIREYEEKYPRLIKPIYQTENQYSKGLRIFAHFLFPKAKGEYLALCEGDDYWTSKLKIQCQLNALYNNPEINFCFTKSYISENEKLQEECLGDFGDSTRLIRNEEVFTKLGCLPTASYFFKKKALVNLPSWFYDEAPVGDVFLEIFAMSKCGVVFLATPSSVYRRYSIGSWTNTIINDVEVRIEKTKKMIKCFKCLLKNDECYLSSKLLKLYVSDRYLELSFYYIDNDSRFLGLKSFLNSIVYRPNLRVKLIKCMLYLILPKFLQMYKIKEVVLRCKFF